jgi:hypothetical protein
MINLINYAARSRIQLVDDHYLPLGSRDFVVFPGPLRPHSLLYLPQKTLED